MSMFENIKTFDIFSLAGKTLEMFITEDSGYKLLAGKDIKTGIVYVLAEQVQ